MLDHDERVMLEALKRHLAKELALHRELLALARIKRDHLMTNQLQPLQELVTKEEALLRQGRDLRRLREDLLGRIAKRMRLEKVTLTAVTADASEPIKGTLRKQGEELKSVLEELTRTNERNQILLRTALQLVREVMGAVVGTERREGYDRGGSSGGHHGAGGILDLRG